MVGYTSWMAESAASVIMIGLSVIVGLYYGCVKGEQNITSNYLLGGKHMSVFPITISLIASRISGISLLGVPTEIYSHGTQYLIAVLMYAVAIVVVLQVYLPVFYELQITSIYEYLDKRFDSTIRGMCSLMYSVSILLYIPQVIYISALVFNLISGFDVHLITAVVCLICIFYTTVGGLKAVVWTDVIQSLFTVGSIVAVIVLGLVKVGGFSNVIKANIDGGRIELFRMNPDPFLRHTFWTVNTGMAFNLIIYLGIHPSAIQRFVALPTYIKARKSLIYFGVGLIVVKVLTGTVGMLIFATYKDCDPILAKHVASDKNLLPYFVMDVAAEYPGLTGLFVSGLVSTALSTMSAQLNTVCATIYKDLLVEMMGIRVSESTANVVMKCIVVVVGIVCVLLVMVVEKLKGIIQLTTSVSGVTNGAILSVFTLGICFPRANSRGAMCGMLASLGLMAWIVAGAQLAVHNNQLKFVTKSVSVAGCPANTTFRNPTDYSELYRMNDDVYVGPNVWKIFTVSYMHYNTIGTVVGIAVGLVVSWLFPKDQNIDPKLLAPCIRKQSPKQSNKTVEFYLPNIEE